MIRLSTALALAAILTACGASHSKVAKALLHPRDGWLVEPSDVGLAFETVEIDVGGGTLHGWFIPADDAAGRTVLVLHGDTANISFYHPYYTFLHEAGFNVFLYDYRGFGKSTGEMTVAAMVYDFPHVMDWLRARPDVDEIALYGISVGTMVAMNAALRYGDLKGLVLEDVFSPVDTLRGDKSTVSTWGLQYTSLPDNTEPDENAERIGAPMLLISGARDDRTVRLAAYRSFLRAQDSKALWILPETARAPNSLLTHDREYQEAITRYLATLFGGGAERLAVECTVDEKGAAGAWLDVTVERRGTDDDSPWPIQICTVDEKGEPSFHNVWLQSERETYRIAAPAEPGMVLANRYHQALSDVDGEGWIRQKSSLSRSGEVWEQLAVEVDVLVNGRPSVGEITATAAKIEKLEAELGPFHPLLESQLAGTYYLIGKGILESGDAARQDEAVRWLQRAVAAEPERPKLHYWPTLPFVAGFPWTEEVQEARALLALMPQR